MKVPKLTLADGKTIPQIGLGLWQVKDRAIFRKMFETAMAVGYRHFDSAQAYNNEALLGENIKHSGLARKDLFVTTKIAVQHFGYTHAQEAFKKSLEKLQMDYVDLLLLHFPVPLLRKKSWLALEKIQRMGGALSIGVSNFTIAHLEQMKSYASVMPAINQVELHVFLQQPELLEYCTKNKIIVEAYSPLAHSRSMSNEVVMEIAEKHKKSYAQIMLRWCIEQGLVVLPKSVTPSRIAENFAIFDFHLDSKDLASLKAQNQNLRTCWDPTRVP